MRAIVKKLFASTLAAAFVVSVGLNLLFLTQSTRHAEAGKLGLAMFGELSLVKDALDYIEKQFVEPKKVDQEKLIYGAIDGMIAKLGDPYSRFMPPEAFKEMQIETRGAFGGLGLIIGQKETRTVVISPLLNTPAYRAGVESGDEILKVDNEPVKGKSVNDVANMLRGKIGTKVHVTCFREGMKKLLEFDIVREEIRVPSITARMLDNKIGYIYLSQFIQTSGEDIEKRVTEFEKQGMKGLILDLRHNPGGLLEAAVACGRIFLPKNATIVTVKDNANNETKYASFGSSHQPFPMVILIDGGTASASEILSGAVHDHHRGILIGIKSFGKGCVQTVLPLSDNSAMALTTAYYYTPSGALIHNKGIQPDIQVALPQMTEAEIKQLREERSRFLDDTPPPKGKPAKPVDMDILRKYDTQFQRAIDVLLSSEIFLRHMEEAKAQAK